MQMNEECLPTGLVDVLGRIAVQLKQMNRLRRTIVEAKDRMRYYFGTFDGKFDDPQLQNVYDVLCRDDEWCDNLTKLK